MNSLSQYLRPDIIQQVSRLDLRARFIVEGFLAGLHASPIGGQAVEFREYRKYTPGDDPRAIDWKVFARTDRLYVRQTAAESSLDCYLVVDASASMGRVGFEDLAPTAPVLDKLQYAIHLAAAIGYLVTRQGDAVGLAVIGANGLQTFLPPRSRRADLAALLGVLAATAPEGGTSLATGLHELLARIAHRGMIVIMSDLIADTEALRQSLTHARFRGHDLIVMHILDVAEARFPYDAPVRLEDPESGEWLEVDGGAAIDYLVAVQEWRDWWSTNLAALRGDYVPLDTSMPFDRSLVEFLARRRRSNAG